MAHFLTGFKQIIVSAMQKISGHSSLLPVSKKAFKAKASDQIARVNDLDGVGGIDPILIGIKREGNESFRYPGYTLKTQEWVDQMLMLLKKEPRQWPEDQILVREFQRALEANASRAYHQNVAESLLEKTPYKTIAHLLMAFIEKGLNPIEDLKSRVNDQLDVAKKDPHQHVFGGYLRWIEVQQDLERQRKKDTQSPQDLQEPSSDVDGSQNGALPITGTGTANTLGPIKLSGEQITSLMDDVKGGIKKRFLEKSMLSMFLNQLAQQGLWDEMTLCAKSVKQHHALDQKESKKILQEKQSLTEISWIGARSNCVQYTDCNGEVSWSAQERIAFKDAIAAWRDLGVSLNQRNDQCDSSALNIVCGEAVGKRANAVCFEVNKIFRMTLPDAASVLLELNANPVGADKGQKTPLMCAAQAGSLVLVKALIQRSIKQAAKINTVDKFGYTAMHYACEKVRFNGKGLEQVEELMFELISAGLSAADLTREGRTPRDYFAIFAATQNAFQPALNDTPEACFDAILSRIEARQIELVLGPVNSDLREPKRVLRI